MYGGWVGIVIGEPWANQEDELEGTLSEVSGHDMAATGACLGSILSSIIFIFLIICILIIAIPAHVNEYVDLWTYMTGCKSW